MDYPNTNKINKSRAFLAERVRVLCLHCSSLWSLSVGGLKTTKCCIAPPPLTHFSSQVRKWEWFAQAQPVSQSLRKVKFPSALIGSVVWQQQPPYLSWSLFHLSSYPREEPPLWMTVQSIFILSAWGLSLLNNRRWLGAEWDMLSAPAYLEEVNLKGVRDTPGICQAEPLSHKLSEMPPRAGRHLLNMKPCSRRKGKNLYQETKMTKCWQDLLYLKITGGCPEFLIQIPECLKATG